MIDDGLNNMGDGFYYSEGNLKITHLVFANDMLLFYNGTKKTINTVWKILKEFEMISGMSINANKSYFFTGKQMDAKRKNWIK